MTAKQRRTLQRWCDRAAPLLGLTDWEIEVLDEPASSGSVATSMCPHGRRYCALRFNPGFADAPEKFIRETLIHELLHAQRAQSKHTVWRVSTGKKVNRQQLLDAYTTASEYEIDSLSIALAPLFPEFHW